MDLFLFWKGEGNGRGVMNPFLDLYCKKVPDIGIALLWTASLAKPMLSFCTKRKTWLPGWDSCLSTVSEPIFTVNCQSPGTAAEGNARGPSLRCQQRVLPVPAASRVPPEPDPNSYGCYFSVTFPLRKFKNKNQIVNEFQCVALRTCWRMYHRVSTAAA